MAARTRTPKQHIPGTDPDSGRPLPLQELSREEFLEAWYYYRGVVWTAEKDESREPLTDEQKKIMARSRKGEASWEDFSRARGYPESEIRDCCRWLELNSGLQEIPEEDLEWDTIGDRQTIGNPEIIWDYGQGKR